MITDCILSISRIELAWKNVMFPSQLTSQKRIWESVSCLKLDPKLNSELKVCGGQDRRAEVVVAVFLYFGRVLLDYLSDISLQSDNFIILRFLTQDLVIITRFIWATSCPLISLNIYVFWCEVSLHNLGIFRVKIHPTRDVSSWLFNEEVNMTHSNHNISPEKSWRNKIRKLYRMNQKLDSSHTQIWKYSNAATKSNSMTFFFRNMFCKILNGAWCSL